MRPQTFISLTAEMDEPGSSNSPRKAREQSAVVSFCDVLTLVVWVSCLLVGIAGLLLHYGRPTPAATPPPIEAEFLNVELTTEPLPPPDVSAAPPVSINAPPPTPQVQPPPRPLSPTPVAAPNAAVAFAVPVEGPVKIVPAHEASPARAAEDPSATDVPAAPVQPLTYGVGEGRQPAPEYPRAAERAGQEGAVRIQFTVGENGRVLAATASSPSPWPLLNESALRVVRERWRFRAGALRVYQVSIRFELRK